MMSLGQDEPIYAYTQPYTRQFIRETCYGRKVRAKTRRIVSSAETAILNVIRSHLDFSKEDICNLGQEKKLIPLVP